MPAQPSPSLPPCAAGRGPRRRLVLRAALAAAVALPALCTAAEPPPAFEVQDLDWVDAARDRAVPVRLYRPGAAAPAEGLPLVVFSHGIGGSRAGYRWLGEHWASHGIASLHLQHVGSDRSLWAGNPLGLVGRLQAAAQEREAIERPRDLRHALDRLLAGPAGDAIDRRRIVAAGHSYGANTVLLAAGAQVERGGRVVDLRDARLAAAIVLSAPPFHGEADPARILGPVALPTLHVTATGDVIRIPGYHSDAADRIALYESTGGRGKALAVYEGGSHSMFTDRAGTGGVLLNQRVKAATQELTLAFLRSRFGDAQPPMLADWARRHRPLLARFDAPDAAGS